MLDWVRSEIARRGLGATVHLLGQHSPSSMPAFFAHADAMLVSLCDDPVFALTVPAKVQVYLACGRPILAMLDGEGARVVQEARAGIACPPGNSAALAQAVLELARMSRAAREQLGANGLAYSRAEFDRDALMDQLERWLVAAARSQPVQRKGKNVECGFQGDFRWRTPCAARRCSSPAAPAPSAEPCWRLARPGI